MSAFEKIAGMFPSRELGEAVAREVLSDHAHELAEKIRLPMSDHEARLIRRNVPLHEVLARRLDPKVTS